MIRRLPQDVIREVVTHHIVAGGSIPSTADVDPTSGEDFASVEAYRSGYAQGFEAGESDGLRESTQRMQELEDAARHHAQELSKEQERLSVLIAGLANTIQNHEDAMELVAFEVALASLTRAFGQMQDDRQLIQRLCAQVVDELQGKAVRVVVSAQDRPMLPEHIDGLEVLVELGLVPGDCRVVTERGQMESSLKMRLRAIYEAMLESVGIDVV